MLRTSLLILLVAGCDLGTVPLPGNGSNPPPGGVDAGGIPMNTGQQNFTANVYTVIEGQCAGCHTAGGNSNFCAATAAASYTAIVGIPAVVGTFDPATAPLLTKIAGGGHNGTAYTAGQSSAITAWLNQENAVRP